MTRRWTEKQRSWLTLLGLWALLLVMACTRPLALPDEGRYAEVGRWMLMSGDWLAPRLDGMPFFHKPPLLHWLQASSFAVWGVHPWSARLVPALHAGLMLLAVYLATRDTQGEKTAQRTIWILGSSLGFLIGGQYVNHDMLVASWVSIAIWAFAAAFRQHGKPDARLALLGFAACALGLLSKGLIGLVLPGLVLLTWLIWTNQTRRLWQLPWIRGLLVFCAIGLPWFIEGQKHYPELFNYLIVGQHFSRYTGGSFNNQWSWWFYPVVIVLLLFPWSMILVGTVAPRKWLHSWRHERTAVSNRWSSLLWIWLLVITAFFSLPKSKIVGYIFTVLPPVACLAAMTWQRWTETGRVNARWFTVLLLASLGLSIGANWAAGRHSLKRSSHDVAHVLQCHLDPAERVYAVGAYPYDLPFYAQLTQALIVLEDWDEARKSSGDNWRRELFEAGDFDLKAAKNLQPISALLDPAENSWLVTPNDFDSQSLPTGWSRNFKGLAWTLWQFNRSAAKGPPTTQDKRLPGC
ncbi:hypothetical protein B9Z52_08285 [Limnohabitans sp. Jir72]|nr:hypothetical protein B9Z52_08285 [Limnohabitans sp. Jir72]